MVDSARSILRYAAYMSTNYRFYFFKGTVYRTYILCVLYFCKAILGAAKPWHLLSKTTAGVPRWTPKQTGGVFHRFLGSFWTTCGVAFVCKLKWKRWFQICFFSVHPYVGKIPILLIFSKGGWNHRVVNSSWESFWRYPNALTPCLLKGQ